MESQILVVAESKYPTLAEIKVKTLKSLDAWWTVFFIDHIAVRFVWLLARVWPAVPPNQITACSLVFGVAAGVLFFAGRPALGAVAYQVCFLMDCVDGKWARLRNAVSERGAFWDGFTNHAAYTVALLGFLLSAKYSPAVA